MTEPQNSDNAEMFRRGRSLMQCQGVGWQTWGLRTFRVCRGGHPSLAITLLACSCHYRERSPARQQVPPSGAAPTSSPGCQSDDLG